MRSKPLRPWPIPTPFPVGPVNAWHVDGAEPALIDPGPKTPEAWTALQSHLKDRRVNWVLFTHHHVDHAGLAARLRREVDVKVAAHELEAGVLERWGEHASEREHDYEEGLRRAGVPGQHRERMRYGGRRFDGYAESVRVDRVLREGDRVRLGDHDFRVLHTPGHTPGSMLLHSPDLEETFSGDTLLKRITPNALSVRASERSALPDYLATLRRLRQEPLGRILPGHGPSFDDAPQVIDAALRHAELRQQRIVRILKEARASAFEVALKLFVRLPENQYFLAVSETLGHLEFLRRARRVHVEASGAVDRYSAAQV